MPRIREDVPENSSEAIADSSARIPSLHFKLTPQGTIDWEKASPKMKERIANALATDPEAKNLMGMKADAIQAVDDALRINESEVKDFIEGYAFVTAQVIPRIVAIRSKGRIVIPPDVAAIAFTFDEKTKDEAAPAGAEWANEHLPEGVKRFIKSIGPGAKFFGALMAGTYAQTKAALQIMESRAMHAPNGANGHAVTPIATGGE